MINLVFGHTYYLVFHAHQLVQLSINTIPVYIQNIYMKHCAMKGCTQDVPCTSPLSIWSPVTLMVEGTDYKFHSCSCVFRIVKIFSDTYWC
jgi:hypothetical protein